MIKLPKEFSAQYSKFLTDQGVEQRLQSFYLKWLRYYLDFCTKYSFKWSEKDSLSAFLIKLKSKNQKPFMLKQAEDAIYLLWKMKNSKKVSKQQKKPPEKSNNFYGIMDQVAKDSRVKHAAIAAKQTNEVLPETKKRAEKQKGADWRQVYSELESSIRMRHYSPRTLKSYVGYTRQFQAFLKSKAPKCVEVEDVKAFLSFMATEKKVSASSQNLAFNALLYLFRIN